MPSSRTIYAASSGSYSDYGVSCLFEQKEHAERYVAAGLAEFVEEFEIYSEMPELFTKWSAAIDKPGGQGFGMAPGRLRVRSSSTTEEPKHSFYENDYRVGAEGPDKERVVKSVTDRYARWKAEQEGIS